jgi:hypothetical protein
LHGCPFGDDLVPEPTFIDPRVEAEFSARGFVKIRLFQADQVGDIRRRMGAMISESAPPNHKSLYSSFLDPNDETRAAISAVVAAMLQPAVGEHIRGGRLRHAGLVRKVGRGAVLPFHHHETLVDRPFDRVINCWLPLSETGPHSGGLRVIPGSHQLLPYIRTREQGDYFASFRSALDKYAEDLSTEIGEAIFFETSLLHGSSENTRSTDRAAITCVTVSDEARNALIIDHDWASFDVRETGTDPAYGVYRKTGAAAPHWRRLRLMPNRNRPISEGEFIQLLDRGMRASEDFDPLDVVRGEGSKSQDGGPGMRRRIGELVARVRLQIGGTN